MCLEHALSVVVEDVGCLIMYIRTCKLGSLKGGKIAMDEEGEGSPSWTC